MRLLCLSMVLLAAACAPPTDNANKAEETANNAAVSGLEKTPADYRAEPPADDTGTLKATPAPNEIALPYTARGQEPGWALTIARDGIDYQGNYGEKKIKVARPTPAPIANGVRYATDRLTVTITFTRCNDAMSGHGYSHEVNITADGEDYDGCGGPRREDWDM